MVEETIGRRVVICGAMGAGKTTLEASLSEALGLPRARSGRVIRQLPVSQLPSDENERVRVALASYPEEWVTVDDIALAEADTVIWLHLPFRVSFWRLLRRTVRRAWTKEKYENGKQESWRRAFFSRKSILLGAIRRHGEQSRALGRRLSEVEDHAHIYELRSARQVWALLAHAAASSRR